MKRGQLRKAIWSTWRKMMHGSSDGYANVRSQSKNCPYCELFSSAFFRIRTQYILSVFSPNAGKCG